MPFVQEILARAFYDVQLRRIGCSSRDWKRLYAENLLIEYEYVSCVSILFDLDSSYVFG